MDIVKRNFFRLLRSGAYDSDEQIEPMSAFKWQKLYQFSVLHAKSSNIVHVVDIWDTKMSPENLKQRIK